jgi:hypothetical protein
VHLQQQILLARHRVVVAGERIDQHHARAVTGILRRRAAGLGMAVDGPIADGRLRVEQIDPAEAPRGSEQHRAGAPVEPAAQQRVEARIAAAEPVDRGSTAASAVACG